MRKLIEDIVKKDINETPYYRLIYRLVETDSNLKKICDFICDIVEGKFNNFTSTYVMCFENLFYFTKIIEFGGEIGKYNFSLEALSDFLWKLAQGEMTFVYGYVFEGAYHYVNISEIHPCLIRTFKFSFMERIKDNGEVNSLIDQNIPVKAKDICVFIDKLIEYAEKYEKSPEYTKLMDEVHKKIFMNFVK